MQNQTNPIVIVNKSIKNNNSQFSNEELLKIKQIFLHRQRYYKNKNKLIYIYNNNSLSLDLKTKNVILDNLNKEVNLRKMPITKNIYDVLMNDLKSLISNAGNQEHSKGL